MPGPRLDSCLYDVAMEPTDWVSAACAALSLGFTALTWWYNHKSKQAKDSAEKAQRLAQDSADALVGMSDEMRKLADAAQGPTLEGEYDGRVLVLRNGESSDMTVVQMDLAPQLLERVGDELLIPRKSFRQVLMPESFAVSVPPEFTVRLSDGRDLLVSIRRTR